MLTTGNVDRYKIDKQMNSDHQLGIYNTFLVLIKHKWTTDLGIKGCKEKARKERLHFA